MEINSTDPILGFLGLVINDSIFVTLSYNKTSFIPPAHPGQASPDATGLSATHTT